jgi:glucose-1-phosphate adenylyltransferase
MKTNMVAMLLAGGRGTRLNLIAAKRAKPAVPFGGMYRIIDFTLTNAMQSGIRHVGVLTQYRPTSLMGHCGDGEAWDLSGRNSCLSILPPSGGQSQNDWYKGTADAVWQNLSFLDHLHPRYVVILSGDHIYSMDYSRMLAEHEAQGADVSVASMEVPWEDTFRFGVMVTDGAGRVTRFVEKTHERISNLANMGIYIFRYDVLKDELSRNIPYGKYDFGADVFPNMIERRKVVTHAFSGYWRDVGTLPSFWYANMDALHPAESGLDLASWRVRTNIEGRHQVSDPPAVLGPDADVRGSLVSRGCEIEGTVRGSVLSPGVVVGKGARVVGSVVMHGCVIEPGAVVMNAILDKGVRVGAGTSLGSDPLVPGENRQFPTHLSGGISVVGKETRIPGGMTIGANVLIAEGLGPDAFVSAQVPDGESVL